jgi:hypothetical protein
MFHKTVMGAGLLAFSLSAQASASDKMCQAMGNMGEAAAKLRESNISQEIAKGVVRDTVEKDSRVSKEEDRLTFQILMKAVEYAYSSEKSPGAVRTHLVASCRAAQAS